jgi:protein gp37
MPGPTAIEWSQRTWNPVTGGCFAQSPGCAHCYARRFAERWRGIPGHPYEQGFDLRLWPERLELPLRWRKPSLIFANSMSDLFGPDVPEPFIHQVLDVMNRAHWHTFQVLTKCAERMHDVVSRHWQRTGAYGDADVSQNVWLGVTIENRRFVHRADFLRATPAAIRWISAEPLLGPLEQLDLTAIDWLIAGGESGPQHSSASTPSGCATCATAACDTERTAFFFKQWGGRTAKAGGRELDGRTHDELPSVWVGQSPVLA